MKSSIDVLRVLGRHIESHKELSHCDAYSAQEFPRLVLTRSVFTELVSALEDIAEAANPNDKGVLNAEWVYTTARDALARAKGEGSSSE